MPFLIEGIKVGLVLCVLLGPIFFTIIQTGVEQGFRAGSMVGLGIWFGDLLYILAAFWGAAQVKKLTAWEYFYPVFGSVGSLILILFGVATLIKKSKQLSFESNKTNRTSSYFSLFMKGFLINGINPFALILWLGIVTTYVVGADLNNQNALWFIAGILGTIIITDLIKILLAKKIRKLLKPIHIIRIRQITGIILIVFGVVVIIRVIMASGGEILM